MNLNCFNDSPINAAQNPSYMICGQLTTAALLCPFSYYCTRGKPNWLLIYTNQIPTTVLVGAVQYVEPRGRIADLTVITAIMYILESVHQCLSRASNRCFLSIKGSPRWCFKSKVHNVQKLSIWNDLCYSFWVDGCISFFLHIFICLQLRFLFFFFFFFFLWTNNSFGVKLVPLFWYFLKLHVVCFVFFFGAQFFWIETWKVDA